MSKTKKEKKIYYCSKCGNVEYLIKNDIYLCSFCNNNMKITDEQIDWYINSIKKKHQTWKDVVRNQYLSKKEIDKNLYKMREKQNSESLNINKKNTVETKTNKTTLCYCCIKCNITKYINNNEVFDGICKCCGQKMILNKNDWWLSGNSINTKTSNQDNIKPTIECPYCHSTNTKKITTTSKVINTAIWGFFGTKRFKEWHCNECGSDF